MTCISPVVGVLDDEPEFRKALRRLLNSRGYRVSDYGCAHDLLEAVAKQHLDCLLLDLHMPGLSGFEVLQAFRARHILVPVVVITAQDAPGTAERAYSLGACVYLKKPVDQDALFRAIEAVLTSRGRAYQCTRVIGSASRRSINAAL